MDTTISTMISQIRQRHGRMLERLLKEAGITDFNSAQGQILRALWAGDGVPITVLAQRTGLAKTSLTGMLDRLEATGLVRRAHGEEDRRQVLIFLTGQAQASRDEYDRVSRAGEEKLTNGMTELEKETLRALLRRVLDNTKEEGD